jgi:hypothetical protein
MEVTNQNIFDANNMIVLKKRITHDSTFEFSKGTSSQNKRIEIDVLVACRFGWAIFRTVHRVGSLCQ